MSTFFPKATLWPCMLLQMMMLSAGSMNAQMPGTPLIESFVPPEARLEMMEKTYAANLRPVHMPLMQDYLRELDLLKTKMTASGRTADAQAVDAEIARVRQAMATTGVFPYMTEKPPETDAPKEGPAAPESKPSPRAVLTLEAHKASGVNLVPGGTVPLGTLEWTVEKLAAGTYDVAMVYACAPLAGPEQFSLTFSGTTYPFTLPAERATGSSEEFRIFRLGTIAVDKEVAGGTFRLQSATPTPKLLIRSVILTRPKTP